MKLSCNKKIKTIYVGGVYHPKLNVFARLGNENIFIPQDQDGIFPYHITFDFGSSFSRDETPQFPGANLRFIGKHIPLSIGVCVNVAPYEKAKCFVHAGNKYSHVQAMVMNMLAYMNETTDYEYSLLLQSFQLTFQSLMAKIDEDVAHENKTDESTHPLTKVKADLDKWVGCFL